eukprot:CAMPEP_0170488222 /NCGR_PEP_ID=MMETSP0208-20121228/6830_1 /TAXON_ID=197538 /ORGANISM="Strombidium inclinatum, Strain S3" /LENGTH=201 /DNA_ID=CAMNT_0010762731 /DNA_START=665 /DNA_END=1271 /DNA_ORIENTATION=-
MILSSRGLRFCLLGGDELARVQGLSGLGAGARVGGWLYEVDVVELLLDLEEIVRDRLARLDLQRIVQMNGSKLVESGWEVHELERVLALDFFEEGAARDSSNVLALEGSSGTWISAACYDWHMLGETGVSGSISCFLKKLGPLKVMSAKSSAGDRSLQLGESLLRSDSGSKSSSACFSRICLNATERKSSELPRKESSEKS